MTFRRALHGRMSLAAAGLAVAVSLAACGGDSGDGQAPAAGDKAKPVIALSNSFIGNSWRKQMVSAFTDTATQAKKDGLISDFVVTNADNTVEQQISQINGLILKKVDAILVDAA